MKQDWSFCSVTWGLTFRPIQLNTRFGFQSLLMGLENRSYKQPKQTIILYVFNIIPCNYFCTHSLWLPGSFLRNGDTTSVPCRGSQSSVSLLAKWGRGSWPILSFLPGATTLATCSDPAHPVQLSLFFFIKYCRGLFASDFHAVLMLYPFFSEILCLILLWFFNC